MLRLFLFSLVVLYVRAKDVTWTQFKDTDNYYMVHRNIHGLNYWNAEKHCNVLGGALASIHSQEENDFIYRLAAHGTFKNVDSWLDMTLIGMQRLTPQSSQWAWSDLTKMDFTNWESDEPNNFMGREGCAVMYTATADFYLPYNGKYIHRGDWADLDCEAKVTSIVCQKEITMKTKRDIVSSDIEEIETPVEQNMEAEISSDLDKETTTLEILNGRRGIVSSDIQDSQSSVTEETEQSTINVKTTTEQVDDSEIETTTEDDYWAATDSQPSHSFVTEEKEYTFTNAEGSGYKIDVTSTETNAKIKDEEKETIQKTENKSSKVSKETVYKFDLSTIGIQFKDDFSLAKFLLAVAVVSLIVFWKLSDRKKLIQTKLYNAMLKTELLRLQIEAITIKVEEKEQFTNNIIKIV